MSENNDDSKSILEMIMNPNKTLANWFVSIGLLGLFLAILNLAGCIHPSYRVSWGGVFTLEVSNKAFGTLEDASAFVVSDAIFMALCAGMVFLGFIIYQAFKDRYDHERHWAVDHCASYWHFLDVVWACMLITFIVTQ